jgi:hypothetical protein
MDERKWGLRPSGTQRRRDEEMETDAWEKEGLAIKPSFIRMLEN